MIAATRSDSHLEIQMRAAYKFVPVRQVKTQLEQFSFTACYWFSKGNKMSSKTISWDSVYIAGTQKLYGYKKQWMQEDKYTFYDVLTNTATEEEEEKRRKRRRTLGKE